jgi:hypothetical protein
MSTQSPPGPSRRTIVIFLILYLLSIGTSLLFLSHFIGIPHSMLSKTVSGKPASIQGKQQAVVYFYNQMVAPKTNDGFLMLYNVSTGQKVQVLQIKNNTITYAQVSPDGQWILFLVGGWRANGPDQLHYGTHQWATARGPLYLSFRSL